jgi:predicted SprT family Zn-dependent metalloprotease
MINKIRMVKVQMKILSIKLQIGEALFSVQDSNKFTSDTICAVFMPQWNAIMINREWLMEARNLEITYVIAHEMRHVYQHLLITNQKHRADIPESVIQLWKIEFENYTMPDGLDSVGYRKQEIEIDAYNYAMAFVDSNGY